ncbi:MAG: hypothetical protein ACT4OS_03270 [Acidimicrobiales bacterium]
MTSTAALVVAALASLHSRLTDIATSLRQSPVVDTVSTALMPRRYESEDRVECYVDVMLSNGNTVGLWLEFRWDRESWLVESSIRHNTDVGEDELVGLPPRYAVDDNQLIAELDGAARALTEAAEQLDLEVL